MICRTFFPLRSPILCLLLLLAAGLAQAQQYRWVDKDGRVQFTDAPPPAWAKDVRKSNVSPGKPAEAQVPFEVARLQKDFPVTLFTTPDCREHCESARGALNKRGVPFREVLVSTPETFEELKNAAGVTEVPALVVGRTVQLGFQQAAYDALLDSAGYPKTGILPPLSQKAPAAPEGQVAGGGAVKPDAQTPEFQRKAGPYDTSGLTGPAPKPGKYDPSGLVGPPPKPGKYGIPRESK